MKKLAKILLSCLDGRLSLIDIGASGGLGSEWKDFRKHLTTIGFEPNKETYKRLVANKLFDTAINCAVFDKKTEVDFNVAKKLDVSSLYLPNFEFLNDYRAPERFKITNVIKMKTDTLDNLLDSNNVIKRDFIAIDTQGSELPILQASPKTVDMILGIRTEVEYAPMYIGQPLEPEVDSFLISKGFEKLFTVHVYWKHSSGKNDLVSGDSIYMRSIESIINLMTPQNSREIAIKALIICAIYGTTDVFDRTYQQLSKYLNKSDIIKCQQGRSHAEHKTESIRSIYI